MQVDVLFPINAGAFTYLVPQDIESKVGIGTRVIAPFKRAEKVGIIVSINKAVNKAMALKHLKAVIDEEPLVTENLIRLIIWVGQYYISTSGLALKNAVPSALLADRKAGKPRITYDRDIKKEKSIKLNEEQQKALNEINKADKGVFLLHGVTGSGKTEVYIQAIKSLPGNRKAIVLVPEIAITAQMIDRFRSSFRDRVVFFHSGLSTGENITNWWKMRRGEVKVVLGVRNVVFAPFQDIGLIVVDEEQESSYKQSEGLRYNARDVALARAKLEGIKVLLGSATPSMESYHNAQNGKFHYLKLRKRVEDKPLPHVEMLDMTKEDKKTWAISNRLLNVLKENHFKGHQAILMLNRRGYSPYLVCTDCGYTYKCPACSITLTYHKDTKTLNCHYCGSYLYPHESCPKCNGIKIKYIGIGTQRVEEELTRLIPEFTVKRMDRDTTLKKLSHYRMVKEMEEKKVDVLLGTQMVAKGHDFPDVTIAAVVSADVALNLPDFRSAEKAFQLFTQLAGRAGRGDVLGKVYIQTCEIGHYVFDYVRNNDYRGFYQKEVGLRKELAYPPFSKLVRIIINFKTRDTAKKTIKNISELIKKTEIQGVDVLGPAPAPIERIRNLWRWHLILKGKNSGTLRQSALEILDKLREIKGTRIDVDVDPTNLL